jgi:hypothetical protein
MQVTFSEPETALLAAFLNGSADLGQFMEGGDYPEIVYARYAPQLSREAREAFERKMVGLA